ncbi:MAG: 5-formyltetrahydrofolate cyclo-ligase [Christensenellales bacterium]|nr:5-formyltetrahydrofolate cyclo-ligase [Christensenellales bacterium]
MDKSALRRAMTQKKRALTDHQIAAASQRLAARLFETLCYQEARSLYVYLSYNQEIRTDLILKQAVKDGKRVAVPKVFQDTMRFLWLTDPTRIAPGTYGIPEPVDDGPVADDENALVLMPGLAFDRQGHRIGYGGGFYDRYLAEQPHHRLIALCYDFQLFDHLETDSHDIPVDFVLPDCSTNARNP